MGKTFDGIQAATVAAATVAATTSHVARRRGRRAATIPSTTRTLHAASALSTPKERMAGSTITAPTADPTRSMP